MYDNDDISVRQIQKIREESPFDTYIIAGDLNNKDAHSVLKCDKNNYETTWDNEILDYIVPINYPTMKLITSVSYTDITDISDHKALRCSLDYSS